MNKTRLKHGQITPASLSELVRVIAPGHHDGGAGIHGLTHWARVLENGLRIAKECGADETVVQLFAIFHDSRRVNDHHDPGHGKRGGLLARQFRPQWFELDDARMDLLEYACAHHTDGLTDADPSVQACWDADRRDLPRVHVTVKPHRLCTAAAKHADTIAWAERRARAGYVADFVQAWSL